MRVLQLIASLTIGGAQTLQVTLAQAIAARAVEMVVASLHHDSLSPNPPLLRAQGRRVEHFPARKLFDVPRLARLLRFVRAEKFDLIHAHLTYANILAPIVGRLTRTPVIGTLHNVRVEPRHYHPLREGWLEPMALRFGAQCVVAVGQRVAEAYQPSLGSQRVIVIPNAVTPIPLLADETRMALRHTLMGDARRPLLFTAGRLAAQKGYPDLLEAFMRVRAAHPSACLAIAGGGHLQNELAGRIEQLGLRGHALLLGARDDVPRLLRASDVYVSASLWEGLPVAVLEAMAAGLPIVATGVGDVPEILAEGAGLITPPAQPAVLAQSISALLDDPARRSALGQAAQARAEKDYSPAAWLDKHLVVYAEVMRATR